MAEGFLLLAFPFPEGIKLSLLNRVWKAHPSVQYIKSCHLNADNLSVASHPTQDQGRCLFQVCQGPLVI